MSKEEILKKHFDVDEMYGRSNMEPDGIYVAMDEYAKQMTLEFFEFEEGPSPEQAYDHFILYLQNKNK